MKKINYIDNLVENLQQQFSKIPNFELTQNDPHGKKIFNFVIKYNSEFSTFQNLFIQNYLPSSKKSTIELKREIKHSKYREFFNLSEEDYDENYYETVRLGYVGAFHKYESFVKNLSLTMDEFFNELDFNNDFTTLTEYLKKEFKIEIKRTINKFHITEKFNWISNCVKHYDGFPIKEPIPSRLSYFDKTKKIQIESKEFKSDMEALIQHNQFLLSTFFLVGFHQFLNSEFGTIKDQLKPENQEEYKVIETRNNMKDLINQMFNNVA